MRGKLPVIIAAIVLLGLLALAMMFMVDTWQRTTAVMSIHGWIALGLGIFFSIILGCSLMALVSSAAAAAMTSK